MSGNPNKKKYKLSPEQEALFKAAFKSGLTGIGNKFTERLNELQRKTGLPMKFVKKKILNMRRGPQKKKQKVIPSLSIEKGKSHFTGYNLFCKETGSLSSNLAERHAKWSALWNALPLAEQKNYNSRAKALKERPLSDLTEIEKELKAMAIINNIGKEVAQLQKLDVHALFAAYATDGCLSHGTKIGLEVWDEINESVILAFHAKNAAPPRLPAVKEGKDELRIKVQNKMAQIYGAFLNGPPKLFPYSDYLDGKLNIEILGLPSGINAIRTPGSMGRLQLEAILAADISLQAQTTGDVDDSASLNNVPCQENLEQQTSTSPQEIQPQENNTIEAPDMDKRHDITFTLDGNILNESTIAGPYQSDNEVEVESCSPSEALQKAVQFAKEVEEKMLPKKTRKGTGRKSYMKGLVGCRVSQLWTLNDGGKEWFDGTIIEPSEGQFAVVFDGEDMRYSFSAAKTKRLLEKKTLKFI